MTEGEPNERELTWLTLFRLYRGWSQRELAEKTGFKQAQISKLESGSRRPRLVTVQRLAKKLDVPTDRLFPYGEPSATEAIAEHFGLEGERRVHEERRLAKEARR